MCARDRFDSEQNWWRNEVAKALAVFVEALDALMFFILMSKLIKIHR